MHHLIWMIILGFVLAGCGYRWGDPCAVSTMTVSIPFIEGDNEGFFTESLIQEVTQRTPLVYRSENASAILQVRLLEVSDENVGFRYDRKRTGCIRHNVVPVETRLIALAEVALIDCNNCYILGPETVSAFIDFDHEYYPNRNAVNVFSLGQLTEIDAAFDEALYPLSRELGRKIADWLLFRNCPVD